MTGLWNVWDIRADPMIGEIPPEMREYSVTQRSSGRIRKSSHHLPIFPRSASPGDLKLNVVTANHGCPNGA